MPARTANLNVEYKDVSDDVKSDVKDIIDSDFHIMADHGTHLNTKPFEMDKSNTELVYSTVNTIKSVVEADVEIKEWDNGNQTSPIDYIYKIYVEGGTDDQSTTINYQTDNSEERSDGHSRVTSPVEDAEPGDGPEWRAFDSESGETETVESTEGESDERDTRVGAPIEKEELTNTIDWKKKDSEGTVSEGKTTDDDDSQDPPETVAEWEMWYPCPTCGIHKIESNY